MPKTSPTMTRLKTLMIRLMALTISLMALSLCAWARPKLEASSPNFTGELKPGGQINFSVRAVNRSKEISHGVLCSVYLHNTKIGQTFSTADLPAQEEILLEGNCSLPQDLAKELQNLILDKVLIIQLQPYRVADLSPADIAVEQTTSGLRWTVTVINKGRAAAPSVPYQLFCDGKAIAQKKILQAIAPGDSLQFTYQDQRSIESGKHKLSCLIDPIGELEDADTKNNQYNLDWQASSNKADLVARGLTLEPEKAVIGSPVRISFELTNTGDIDMFKLPVSLKVNNKIEVEKKFFQSLAPGGETNLTLTWVPSQAGEHNLSIICQGASSPTKSIIVGGRPGYQFGTFTANIPKRSRQGKDWVFTTTFTNTGTLPCDGVRAILWSDGSKVWSSRLGNSLNPGQEASLDLRWSAEKPGNHQLRIEITAQGAKANSEADINQAYQIEVEPTHE